MKECWIVAECPIISEAYDCKVFFVKDDANRICGNLIVNTRKPYRVWRCEIAISPEEPAK